MATEQDPKKYKTYAAAQKERGYKKIHRWIPACEEERVNRYLARVVNEFKKSKA